MPRLPAVAIAINLAAAATAQTVHVVGPGGYAQIQTAISAAGNGDVVVVQTGNYLPFTLNKDLVVTAAPGATVTVVPSMVGVTMLQPPNRAELVGMHFRPVVPFLPHDVRVLGGHVVLQDCRIESILSPGVALNVQNAHAALQRCLVYGGPMPVGGTAPFGGGDAVAVTHGSLAAVDCEFRGGDLGWDFLGRGGHALAADDASVHLVRCTLVAGGNSAFISVHPAGNGVFVGTTSEVTVADSLVRGGDGHATAGNAAIRNLGATPVVLARTTLQAGPGTPPGPVSVGPVANGALLGHGSTTAALVLGQAWTLHWLAGAGTPVLAVCSDGLAVAAATPLLAERAWLAPANLFVLGLGVTDATGSLITSLPLPTTPALLHTTWFVQGVAGLAAPLELSPPVGGVAR